MSVSISGLLVGPMSRRTEFMAKNSPTVKEAKQAPKPSAKPLSKPANKSASKARQDLELEAKTRKVLKLAPKTGAAGKASSAAAKPRKAAATVIESQVSMEMAPKQREMPPNPPSRPSKELHAFPNPAPERDYVIQFQVPEFTCHCPLTGQPDFAHFTIDMIADKYCVELKSLKMYFWSYRNEGAFHEKVTNTILEDIVKVTNPRFIRITAKWYVRGGIYTNVVVEHRKKGWQPLPRVDLPEHGFQSGLLA